MRELKFRAWDKITKKYYAVGGLSFDENGKLCEVYLAGIPTTDLNEDVREPSDVILEQYTGLKDKNGKEIYEGDIVEASIDGMWSTGRNTVSFGKAKWKLEVIYNDIRFMDVFKVIGSRNAPDRIYYLFDKELSELEVIGNIHKNPELLGDINVTNKEEE